MTLATLVRRSLLPIIFLLLLGNANAELVWKKYSYTQNWGGLNDNLSTTEINDNEATDLQNVVFDNGGSIKKRYGYETSPKMAKVGTASAITGIKFFKNNAGTKYLVAVANCSGDSGLYVATFSTLGFANGYWKIMTPQHRPAAYGNNYLADFTIASNCVIYTDGYGTTGPYRFDGTRRATRLSVYGTYVPKANMLEYHKNHLFLANNISTPSRVYFSNLGYVATFSALDFFDIDNNDGTKITGLLSALNSLYIFKEKSVWRLSGEERDSYKLEKTVSNVGAVNQQTIQVVGNLIYFMSPQGDIVAYDGGYGVVFVSSKIRNTISNLQYDRIKYSSALAFSSYRNNDYDYYVSSTYTGGTANNRILLFDTFHKAWTKFTGVAANCMTLGEDANGKNALFFGDYSGYVHRYPSSSYYDGNVATSAIEAFYQTKWFRYPEISLGDKYWRAIRTYWLTESADTSVQVECKSDYEDTGSIKDIDITSGGSEWGVMVWGVDKWAGTSIVLGSNGVHKGKEMFQAKFINEEVDQGFTLLGYEMFIEPTTQIDIE